MESLVQYRAELSKDGKTLDSPGVDWGKPLVIQHSNGTHYVIRRAGHMTWSGVGMQEYEGTLYMLVRLEPKGGKTYMTILSAKLYPGRKWRECLATLVKQCDEAAKSV